MLGNDFDKQFDSHFKSTHRLAVAGFVFGATLTVGVIVFLGWVVVMVLRHYGVV